jgi:hypothetical protein
MKFTTRNHPHTPKSSTNNCRFCRSRSPRKNHRAPATHKPRHEFTDGDQIARGMYRYLTTLWDSLPLERKQALGFDPAMGIEGEEKMLNQMARLLLEYAEQTFQRALMARRRRLGQ